MKQQLDRALGGDLLPLSYWEEKLRPEAQGNLSWDAAPHMADILCPVLQGEKEINQASQASRGFQERREKALSCLELQRVRNSTYVTLPQLESSSQGEKQKG